MKKIIIGALLALSPAVVADTLDKGVITLTSTNHVSLAGEVNEDTITKVILELSGSTAPVTYLYINSFGGSVFAGNRLIQYFTTTEKKIVCVAQVAISMAHQILQACQTRVGTPDNVLMQHRMTAGAQGNVDQMTGLTEVLRKLEIQLNTISANRIGISLVEFFKKVNLEWWTFGKQSKELNIVDKISHVGCEESLYKIDKPEVIRISMFSIPILVNACPLVPIRLDSSRMDKSIPKEVLDKILFKAPVPGLQD